MEDKIQYLKKLRIRGQLFLHFIDKVTKKIWVTWKNFDECNAIELQEANLRTLLQDEIVLDTENPNDLQRLENLLIEKKYNNYKIFNTGSRGIHVHLMFSKLASFDKELRNKIRKKVIEEFNCDPTKSIEHSLIAVEFAPHFKTGKYKTLIKQYNVEDNILDEKIIEESKKDLEKEKQIKKIQYLNDEEFKNYHLTDKFFGFIKENVIPDNTFRDAIVFKNLAVALVKEGLNNNDIKNIMQPIINENFPGKNYNELNGWIRKVRQGQINYYNIYELNQWGDFFFKTIFYQEICSSPEMIKMLPLKYLWDIYWSENMVGQNLWKDLLFYSMIGITLDERDENKDYRIHITFSSFTTTGKDAGVNLLINILDDPRLNIESAKPTEVTDKFLIGGVDDKSREFNMKHNLTSGELKMYRGEEITGKEELIYGAYYRYNLLAFTEAEVVFMPSTFNKRIQLNLRRVMDIERKPFKGVGNYEITYFCNPTIILTTFPVPKIMRNLLTNGLFQRTFFLHEEISDEFDEKIINFLIEKGLDTQKLKRSQMYKEEIVKRLIEIKDYYYKNKEEFLDYVDTGYKKYVAHFKSKIKKLKKEYEFLDDDDKKVLDAIVRRGISNIEKLMILDLLSTGEKILTKKHIDKSINIFERCVNSIRDLIWTNIRSKYIYAANVLSKEESAILKLIEKNSDKKESKSKIIYTILSKDLLNLIEKKLKIKSSTTRSRWLSILINERRLLNKKEYVIGKSYIIEYIKEK